MVSRLFHHTILNQGAKTHFYKISDKVIFLFSHTLEVLSIKFMEISICQTWWTYFFKLWTKWRTILFLFHFIEVFHNLFYGTTIFSNICGCKFCFQRLFPSRPFSALEKSSVICKAQLFLPSTCTISIFLSFQKTLVHAHLILRLVIYLHLKDTTLGCGRILFFVYIRAIYVLKYLRIMTHKRKDLNHLIHFLRCLLKKFYQIHIKAT